MAAAARELGTASRIVIAGAGSIGCFVGGMLLRAGRNVAFLARPRIAEELRAHGLRLTALDGLDERIAVAGFDISVDPGILSHADLVLVTVKSGATRSMAAEIAAHCPPGATVLSLQNGVGNVAALRGALTGMAVLGGMVGYNVVGKGGGRFHRGTSGDIVIERGRADVAALMDVPGLGLTVTRDIYGVQWGKLLLNLNNALNALSGLPLRRELEDRGWRKLLAGQIREALRVTRAAGISPVSRPLPPRFLPGVLSLPTPLFRIVAAPVLRVDPEARSSMWEDLSRGRPTEIDYLQGEVVALGRRHAIATPLCTAVAELVRRAEAAGAGPPALTPGEIAAAAQR
jgi:2-dehydropantoate 2-reductase